MSVDRLTEQPYSIPTRALHKWSQERLQLRAVAPDVIEAVFSYEGTTCSNMGRPLEYIYRVKLGGAAGGHKIMAVECAPAPGDTGHRFMCEYIKAPESFLAEMSSERPLINQPIDAVLTWECNYAPSGCYCQASSRRHKWRLVFEVIHYALGQLKNQENEKHYEEAPMLDKMELPS